MTPPETVAVALAMAGLALALLYAWLDLAGDDA